MMALALLLPPSLWVHASQAGCGGGSYAHPLLPFPCWSALFCHGPHQPLLSTLLAIACGGGCRSLSSPLAMICHVYVAVGHPSCCHPPALIIEPPLSSSSCCHQHLLSPPVSSGSQWQGQMLGLCCHVWCFGMADMVRAVSGDVGLTLWVFPHIPFGQGVGAVCVVQVIIAKRSKQPKKSDQKNMNNKNTQFTLC